MRGLVLFFVAAGLLLFAVPESVMGQTIEQKLLVFQNDATLGGNFVVSVQVKGTSLPAANTLGSATIDVQFDNTKLTFVSATNWAFGAAQGYTRSATNNTTFIRVGVLGTSVGTEDPGLPPGFDVGTTYTTWVRLNFTIAQATSTNLTVDGATNAVGLFANYQNNPNTGVINNQTLTAPENIINVALPIQLAAFTAAVINQQNHVRLDWTTLTETNNYGFEVQKLISATGTFETIPGSFIPGAGTTVDPRNYTYTDVNGSADVWYRLKQTDLDGPIHFSEPIQPSNPTSVGGEVIPTTFALRQNYPNPFNPATNLSFDVPTGSFVTIKLYNTIGQEVATLVNGDMPAGRHSMKIEAATYGLSSGMYIYRMIAGEFTATRKMMLLR